MVFRGTSVERTLDMIRSRWLGYVVRMHPDRIAHRALFATNGLGWIHRRSGQPIIWFSGRNKLPHCLSHIRSGVDNWRGSNDPATFLFAVVVLVHTKDFDALVLDICRSNFITYQFQFESGKPTINRLNEYLMLILTFIQSQNTRMLRSISPQHVTCFRSFWFIFVSTSMVKIVLYHAASECSYCENVRTTSVPTHHRFLRRSHWW